ncbi:7-cyano-7-deazaguanine synthase QueC [Frankia sp. CcI49]|uniref:7-cyano-7-deazaguanine synthase QueC n=1 Tax=Frankia sp. CcI49 TaxID=1745382 RepID=UPI000976C628|nr:7-cyano-7-deazaguanine synthase QueC [Frankia sp. CcI49]ONH58384.1 7-cyano-7-deazaguanine synthase QueC [Frankia sp. CcI49]
MPRDLVLLSGGLDSSTLLAERAKENTARLALSVNYGQRHARELRAAADVAAHYRVPHLLLDLTGWGSLLAGSALTDEAVDVPHGHYAAESMRATVVPNRNATLLMAAAGVALAHGCDRVLTAVHAGDHPIYPDCRPEFIAAASEAAQRGTDSTVAVEAPYVHTSKADIARIAGLVGLPVALTWSCYEGGERHCGRCGTCVERAEALHLAGVPDPTSYVDPDFWRAAASSKD